ncbi:MAG: glycosyltransferase, partial [Acidobacteriota bacterium]|nr:glycosyltransferase [Acidobacteriota bacterium]
ARVHTFFTVASPTRHQRAGARVDADGTQLPASGEGVLAHIHLIYVGPLDPQHRVRELADAFLAAHDHDPRLHLLIVGEGSERAWLERHLGRAASFLGPTTPGPATSLAGPTTPGAASLLGPTTPGPATSGAADFPGHLTADELDELSAHADLLVSPTTAADTAETIVAAQRAGVPVLAVDGGEAAALIENGRSGFLVPDDLLALADAIRWLSRRATLRERLATGGRLAAGARLPSERERIMSG